MLAFFTDVSVTDCHGSLSGRQRTGTGITITIQPQPLCKVICLPLHENFLGNTIHVLRIRDASQMERHN